MRAALLRSAHVNYATSPLVHSCPSQATRAHQDTKVLVVASRRAIRLASVQLRPASMQQQLTHYPANSVHGTPNITAPSHFLIWGKTMSGRQKGRHVVMPSSIAEGAGPAVKLRPQAMDAGGEPEKPQLDKHHRLLARDAYR